ncbi:MAG: esterase-like activity of phytase family protein [Acidobacteriota bacterium]
MRFLSLKRFLNHSLLLAAVTLGGPHLYGQSWKIESVYALPDMPLSSFLKSTLGLDVEDHNIKLGGIGSDLWHSQEDGPGVYWTVTDRGPNGQIRVNGVNRRTFPIPAFTPFILKVRTAQGRIDVLEAIPITGLGPALGGVSGISNTSRDEKPFDCAAQTELDFNPHGLDTEGLVRTLDGTFWLVDEYSPSIIKVDRTGRVSKRFVPVNLSPPTLTAGYPTIEVLPQILGKRKANRGFEGVALTPNQKTIYAVVQSPLSNPNKTVGDASRNTRIIGFDVETEMVVSEYLYRFQPVTEFGDSNPAEMKVSGLAMLDPHTMLVLERTDKVAKIYRVDLKKATNLLGTIWDDASTTPSLEALDEAGLAQNGIRELPKTLVLEMDSAKGFPEKIEGLAVLDGQTLAIANDNDFGVGTFLINENECTLVDSRIKSSIVVLRLENPIRQ